MSSLLFIYKCKESIKILSKQNIPMSIPCHILILYLIRWEVWATYKLLSQINQYNLFHLLWIFKLQTQTNLKEMKIWKIRFLILNKVKIELLDYVYVKKFQILTFKLWYMFLNFSCTAMAMHGNPQYYHLQQDIWIN